MQAEVCECTYQESKASSYRRCKVLSKTGECPLMICNILSQTEAWRLKYLVNKALSNKKWNYSEVNMMSKPNTFPAVHHSIPPSKTGLLWTMILDLLCESRFLALHLQNSNRSVNKSILRHFCICRFRTNVLDLGKALIKHPTIRNRDLSLSKATKNFTCQWLENNQMYQISRE